MPKLELLMIILICRRTEQFIALMAMHSKERSECTVYFTIMFNCDEKLKNMQM